MTEQETIRVRHLRLLTARLLRSMEMQDVEFGAPGVDPKQPFGFSSGIEGDILEGLDIKPEGKDPDYGDEIYTEEQEGYARELWADTIGYMHRLGLWIETTTEEWPDPRMWPEF